MEGKITENQIIGDNKAKSDNMDVLSISNGLNMFFGKLGWDYGLLRSRGHTFGIWKLDPAENPNNIIESKSQELKSVQFSVSELTNSKASRIHHNLIEKPDRNDRTDEKTEELKCDEEKNIDEYYIHIGSDEELLEKIEDDEKKLKADDDKITSSKKRINKNKKGRSKKKQKKNEKKLNIKKVAGKKKKGKKKNVIGKGKNKKVHSGRKKDKRRKIKTEKKISVIDQEIVPDVQEDHDAENNALSEVNSESVTETVHYITDTDCTVFENFDGDNCLIFLWDPRGTSFGKSTEASRVPVVVCFDSTKKFEDFFVKTVDKIGLGSHRFIISGVQLIDKIENNLQTEIGTMTGNDDKHFNEATEKKNETKTNHLLSAVYEKRLTKAYVYSGGGKIILWPTTTARRSNLTCLQWSSAWCVAILIMTRIIQIDVLSWNSEIMDDASAIALEIRNGSIEVQGKECKNILMPEQVFNDITIGKISIHFDLQLLMTADVGNQSSISELQICLEQSVFRDSSLTLIWSSTYGCSAAFSSKSKNVYFLAACVPSPCIFSYSSPENLVIGYSSMAVCHSDSPGVIMLYDMNLTLRK